MQLDLDTQALPADWLPDETVYSLCGRYHRVSGHVRASTTCLRLFGHARIGSGHDFPSRLDELAERLPWLGSTEEITRHTLLPFYAPFCSAALAQDATTLMRGSGIRSLKFALGILTSRFGADHPLKACPVCMERDRNAHATAYWHLQHQLPGTWVCLTHDTWLEVAPLKGISNDRFDFFLPDSGRLRSIPAAEKYPIGSPVMSHAKDLAVATGQIFNLPAGLHLDSQRLLQTYLSALARAGYQRGAHQLDRTALGEEISKFVQPFRQLPDLSALPKTPGDAASQFRRLLSTPRTGTHPLRHLVLILCLFGTWQKFWRMYSAAAPTSSERQIVEAGPATQPSSGLRMAKQQVLDDLERGASSVSAAAARAGVSSQTGLSWAAEAGIAIQRRPKRLGQNARARAVQALDRGGDVSAIAREAGVSQQTIRRVLTSEPGLRQRWLDIRKDQKRTQMREQWRTLTQQHRHAGPKICRQLAPAIYAWLYRHDRAWLASHNRSFTLEKRGNNSRLNWDERDRTIAASVLRVATELIETQVADSVTLTRLCRELPELRAKLKRLDRLPLTRKAIDRATASPSNRKRGSLI